MDLDHKILTNILAIDKAVEEYEFIHVYLGSEDLLKKAETISVDSAYEFLSHALETISGRHNETYPLFRKIYIQDLIRSIMTQVESFVFRQKKKSIKNIVESLMGTSLCPMFDIEEELESLTGFINHIGYSSVADYKNRKKIITFKSTDSLKTYLNELINSLSRMTLELYSSFFDLDLEGILEKSCVEIELTQGEPPCYYYYQEKYKGVAGVTFQEAFSEIDLKNFLCHEMIPGHHFYYLLKQSALDEKNLDMINAIDTFYSPENVINEGIAMNSELILEGMLDDEVTAAFKIEKFLHKIFYNSWYLSNIEGGTIDPVYIMILRNEFNFSYDLIDRRMTYFTKDAKYYTPCYPLGSFYVEQFIRRFGIQALPKLYCQHSINTMDAMINEMNVQRTANC